MRTRILLLPLLAGCSGGTDLENPEHVTAWANSASALAVFVPAYEPLAIAYGERAIEGDCPSVEDDGRTLVVTGDCTTAQGRRFGGRVTLVRGGDVDEVTFEGYGSASEGDAVPQITGTIVVSSSPLGHIFEADYVQDGLLTLDVDYQGSFVGGFEGATRWNGSGTITRGGFTDASGTATATTVDQVRDGAVCSSESASGTTRLVIGDRVLVVEYDGATDCDDTHTARYRVDGEDRGEVEGVVCAASPWRGGSWAPLLALGVAGLALARRRHLRRRRCVSF